MRVLISGSGGLIGSTVAAQLAEAGEEVWRLVRGDGEAARTIRWDPESGQLDPAAVSGFDAVVHLAGEPVAGRWTAAKKKRIRASRVEGTRVLAEALQKAEGKPDAFLCASAVGYYGSRGDTPLTEAAQPGSGFLAEVARAWEAATAPAADAGIRTVSLRFGMVLSPEGGALAQMLPIFRAGLGGRLGDGTQYWPWVHIADATGAIRFALSEPAVTGPVNVAAPHPVTCDEFTRALGRVLEKRTCMPVPRFAARAALGEMADELLFASCRAVPERLQEAGYAFAHEELEPALRDLLA